MSNVTLTTDYTTQAHYIGNYKNLPLTTLSNSLRCVSAAEHHTAEHSTPKRAGQKPESITQEAIIMEARTSSRYEAFEKLLSKLSKDVSQKSSWNQMWLPTCQGHQTPSVQFCQ